MLKYNTAIRNIFVIGAIISLFFLTACGDPASPTTDNFSISFATENNLSKPSADSLRIDTVKILLRSLKVKSTTSNDSLDIKVGPFVVHLNSNQTVHTVSFNEIPTGSYRRVEFHIHKLENSETPPDPEFRESADNRFSVIVKGEYNSAPFIYRSEKSAKQTVDIETSVEVNNNEVTNVTLVVDPYTWFVRNGAILDPTNTSNVNDIDNMIKDSFKRAFKDNNKDGKPDNNN
jgi:hypothetical protein